MIKKNLLIAGAMLSCGAAFSFSEVQAQTCVVPPSCEELGYKQTEADCEGATLILKCPTDPSQVACPSYPDPCGIGDVLYGDGYCYKDNFRPKNIAPIGVVFDTTKRLAVALTDVGKDGSAGTEGMTWSSSYCDTPNLENCDFEYMSCGADGRVNTDAILASTCNGTTYAANAVNAYQTSNCSADFCQQGKWFLPSLQELYTIHINRSVINSTLSLLSTIGAKQLMAYYCLSSTEYSDGYVWSLNVDNANHYFNGKNDSNQYDRYNYVRPVLAF